MGHIIKVRRGNATDTRFITIPRAIADMLNIKIGTKIEISQFSSDQLLLKVLKDENKANESQ